MHDYKETIFKLVGRFNIQGGVIKQALATDILCKNGLRPFDHKNHDIKDIGILIISEAEYNKPSEFLGPVRDSGGRLVKKKWIEDLHFKRTWLDPCGDYLWEELGCVDDKDVSGDDKYKWQDDDYEQGDDDDDESDDDDYEPEDDDTDESEADDYEHGDDDDASDIDESGVDEPETYDYEVDEELEESYWKRAYNEDSEDESYWKKA
ncbi:uncharacterized protein FPRO_16053 [Fusarium proliferatum ET1]|uniref:Uncharacterized protein n=1 Tax=Fusarium proliferatum (strain ET1) TaxID=1227346 RepID=A0A1L7WB54_FUSPR|nr:uncharacterized protein FPRO_16053 [Fusarium proliferatum ET1]CZR49845.1 uncharacterized protein FPRO_16053 [Fusarium proliferatum ET1]